MEENTSEESALISLGLKRLVAHNREAALDQMVEELLRLVQNENYHYSEVFAALERHMLQKSTLIPDDEAETTWRTVATLLKTAAAEAETEGRELP